MVDNYQEQPQNSRTQSQPARIGTGRTVKPKKEIKDSDYRLGSITQCCQYSRCFTGVSPPRVGNNAACAANIKKSYRPAIRPKSTIFKRKISPTKITALIKSPKWKKRLTNWISRMACIKAGKMPRPIRIDREVYRLVFRAGNKKARNGTAQCDKDRCRKLPLPLPQADLVSTQMVCIHCFFFGFVFNVA